MEIHVINLERSRDRRAHMIATLGHLGLEFFFARAVDASLGEHLAHPHYDAAETVRARGEELVPSEIGCFASHYSLWRKCIETGRPMVVMEDDMVLDRNFAVALDLAERELGRYGLIRLEGLWVPPHGVLATASGFSLVRFRKGAYGCGAYTISPAAAERLVEHARLWRRPVDVYMNRYWEHGVPCVAILPYPAGHADGLASLLEPERGTKPWRSRRARLRARVRGIEDEASRHLYLLTRGWSSSL